MAGNDFLRVHSLIGARMLGESNHIPITSHARSAASHRAFGAAHPLAQNPRRATPATVIRHPCARWFARCAGTGIAWPDTKCRRFDEVHAWSLWRHHTGRCGA